MIANCPSCGTHYKYEAPKAPAAMKCARCDSSVDLDRFRPYRIVRETSRPMTYVPIGVDHPSLTVHVAAGVSRPMAAVASAASATRPEMAQSFFPEQAIDASAGSPVKSTIGLLLCTAAAAAIGAGASAQWGGTPPTGLVAGGVVGAVAWWGFRQWTSRR